MDILVITLTALVTGVVFSLYRAIRGPRRADHIMGINMIGSFATLTLALLSVMLKESWLLDICLVFSLISFLAVITLTKNSIIEKQEGK